MPSCGGLIDSQIRILVTLDQVSESLFDSFFKSTFRYKSKLSEPLADVQAATGACACRGKQRESHRPASTGDAQRSKELFVLDCIKENHPTSNMYRSQQVCRFVHSAILNAGEEPNLRNTFQTVKIAFTCSSRHFARTSFSTTKCLSTSRTSLNGKHELGDRSKLGVSAVLFGECESVGG